MDELKKHKDSDSFKWGLTLIAFILIGMILVGIVSGSLPIGSISETPETENESEVAEEFSTEFMDTENITFSSISAMTYSSGYASQKITAKVVPEGSSNKKVTWDVYWAESNTKNVGNYVKVIPDEDNNLIANIVCYQPFTGDIVVEVKTKVGGFTAQCIVRFQGAPTDLEIKFNHQMTGSHYVLNVGDVYVMTPEVTGTFDQVGQDYKTLEIDVDAVGSVILSSYEYYNQNGAETWYDATNKEVSLESLMDELIEVTYKDGVITVKPLMAIEDYFGSHRTIDGGRTEYYQDKFRSFVGECYFNITVKEPVSGLTDSISLKIASTNN